VTASRLRDGWHFAAFCQRKHGPALLSVVDRQVKHAQTYKRCPPESVHASLKSHSSSIDTVSILDVTLVEISLARYLEDPSTNASAFCIGVFPRLWG
jgi:hypothetical protein